MAAMRGEANPIAIFPEGCTTNGKYLIEFKKGAFDSLLPVQPHCIKYRSLRSYAAHGDATSTFAYTLYSMYPGYLKKKHKSQALI